nr:hypothetical protein [uncultured Mediterranean phage uvMED]|tara:strand:- start:18129 stop:18389 length:261 start_codon:yes stop_codon:yes gene_type:complete
MFVLLDIKTGGVYAVRDDDSVERVVQMFIDKDDAVRYYEMLKDLNYNRELEVKEIEEGQVKDNCINYGYRFTVITPDDIVIPPPLV